MNWYCDASKGHAWHEPYHDHVYGFPVREDDRLFERLSLELNQAGLSWLIILRKVAAFKRAFCDFSVGAVADFGEGDVERLLADKAIIRNRLKIRAVIHNARVVQGIQMEYGSFRAWLDAHHPLPLSAWVDVFKGHFRFMGPEIVNEFLMSVGYLEGAHKPSCPIYQRILALEPPWLQARRHDNVHRG